MVLTVQCPAAACRKFLMIEEADRGRVVSCLLCGTRIAVPAVSRIPSPVFDVPTLTPIDVPPQQGFLADRDADPDADDELTDDELLGLQ